MAVTLWINPEITKNLIGVTAQIFVPEISAFKPVRLSPGEAIRLLKDRVADITIDWLTPEGQVIQSFAKARWTADRHVAIFWSDSPAIVEAGYLGRQPRPDNIAGWYMAIGSGTYPLISCTEEGNKIGCDGPGDICHYEGRLEQLCNLGGHDSIRRSVRELCGAAARKRFGVEV